MDEVISNLTNELEMDTDFTNQHFINHLLATKLEKPPLTTNLVERNRLTDALFSNRNAKVSLIVAPAGYGKTTLLGGWISKRLPFDWKIAWVSLDEYDNRMVRFWSYITKAIQQINPKLKINLPQLNKSQSDQEDFSYLNLILNEIAAFPDPICLILDDYHLITDEMIHRSLGYFIEHQPRNFHIIISTRHQPPIPLSRLRALGDLIEVSIKELSFTPEEVRIFLANVMGLTLNNEQIALLTNATEGWIAGLKLAALSIHDGNDIYRLTNDLNGDYSHIFDFLIEEVLNHQDEETKDFLLKTSVLSEFSAQLCDAIFERSDSQSMLNHIVHNQLFIFSLDNNQQWFRYHHLFAQTLQKLLLENSTESRKTILRKAGEWFMKNGYSDKAVSCALDSGDLATAAKIIEQYALSALTHFDLDRLIQWINRLRMDLIEERPQLGMYVALAYFLSGSFNKTINWLNTTENILDGKAIGNIEIDQVDFIRWEIAALRTEMKCFGDKIDKAIDEIIDLRNNAPVEDVYFVGSMTHILAETYVVQGDLEKGLQEFFRCMDFALKHQLTYEFVYSLTGHAQVLKMQGCLSLLEKDYNLLLEYVVDKHLGEIFKAYAQTGLAEIAVEKNQPQKVWQLVNEIEQNLPVIENEPITWIRPEFLYVRLSKCFYALRDFKKAKYYFHLAVKGYHDKPNIVPFLSSELIDMQAKIILIMNTNFRIHGYVNMSAPSKNDKLILEQYIDMLQELDPYGKSRIAVKIASAKIYSYFGREPEAIVILDDIISFLDQAGLKEREIESLILLSRCWYQKGESLLGRQTLYRALLLAEKERILDLFLEGGQTVYSMLENLVTWMEEQNEEQQYRPMIDFAQIVLGSYLSCERDGFLQADSSETVIDEFSPLMSLLSQREQDVMELLLKDMSVKEISSELLVTSNTTKTHLQGIYKKLGVHTKRDAIRLFKRNQ